MYGGVALFCVLFLAENVYFLRVNFEISVKAGVFFAGIFFPVVWHFFSNVLFDSNNDKPIIHLFFITVTCVVVSRNFLDADFYRLYFCVSNRTGRMTNCHKHESHDVRSFTYVLG